MASQEDELASTKDLWLIETKDVLLKDCTSEVQKRGSVDCDEVKNISGSQNLDRLQVFSQTMGKIDGFLATK